MVARQEDQAGTLSSVAASGLLLGIEIPVSHRAGQSVLDFILPFSPELGAGMFRLTSQFYLLFAELRPLFSGCPQDLVIGDFGLEEPCFIILIPLS